MYSLILVDDEIWTLRDMEVLLRDVPGFVPVGMYTDPVEAKQAILHSPPNVVLTDLKMEELSGQQLMKTIHEHCPKTRIIICSAYRDFDAARDAIKYDVIDYLVKPIVKSDFLSAFEKARILLDREQSEESSFTRQRVVASEHPWTEQHLCRIKNEAPCPCRIEQRNDAFAVVYYDNADSIEAWIQSLPDGLGFSQELPAGSDEQAQHTEALIALCAGFAYTLHKPLNEVQSYIALHCGEKLTLNSIAEEIGFSSAYLCDLFRKKCGIQLFAFIKQIRIGLACHLLKTTDLPVHIISGQVGYEDNSHFCREFKNAKGITPNAYRQAEGHPDPDQPES